MYKIRIEGLLHGILTQRMVSRLNKLYPPDFCKIEIDGKQLVLDKSYLGKSILIDTYNRTLTQQYDKLSRTTVGTPTILKNLLTRKLNTHITQFIPNNFTNTVNNINTWHPKIIELTLLDELVKERCNDDDFIRKAHHIAATRATYFYLIGTNTQNDITEEEITTDMIQTIYKIILFDSTNTPCFGDVKSGNIAAFQIFNKDVKWLRAILRRIQYICQILFVFSIVNIMTWGFSAVVGAVINAALIIFLEEQLTNIKPVDISAKGMIDYIKITDYFYKILYNMLTEHIADLTEDDIVKDDTRCDETELSILQEHLSYS